MVAPLRLLLTNFITFSITGKDLTFSTECPSSNLKILCAKLRGKAHTSSTVNCCVKQSKMYEEGEQHRDLSERTTRNSRSSRKHSSEEGTKNPEANATSFRTHQRCTVCRKGSRNCSESPQRVEHKLCKTSEVSENERANVPKDVHLDGSECACNCGTCCWVISDSAYELLERCLDFNPHTRISASEALDHPFFKN